VALRVCVEGWREGTWMLIAGCPACMKRVRRKMYMDQLAAPAKHSTSPVSRHHARVQGSGFRVQGLGFRGLGFRGWGFGLKVHGLGFKGWGLGVEVWG
jgi:hypothetical protein